MIKLSIVSNVNPVKNKPKFIEYAKRASFYATLQIASKAGSKVYTNTVNKINNYKYARTLNGKITIQDIFIDNWDSFVQTQKNKGKEIRQSIIDNVEAMIHCRDFEYGYLFFECPNCENIHVQGFSCHSRFCASCGKKYRDARANEISSKCIAVPHRHITWTIAKELRKFFRYHNELYDELFASVNDVLTNMIKGKSKKAKKEGRTLGFISTIHTFGRDLKHNPHIHTLVAECTIDKNGVRKSFTHFNYNLMRKSFMTVLLNRMQAFLKVNASKELYDEFMKVKFDLYKSKNNGFYVHAPKTNIKNFKDIKKLVNYVCRYAGHPAISESRILEYNEEKKLITYCYDPHEDDAVLNEEDKIGTQYVTESIDEFIAKLIVHIPNKSVHTTRYYGFYANHSAKDLSKERKLYSQSELNTMKSNLSWRTRLLNSYKYDPLLCECGHYMVLNIKHSYLNIGG